MDKGRQNAVPLGKKAAMASSVDNRIDDLMKMPSVNCRFFQKQYLASCEATVACGSVFLLRYGAFAVVALFYISAATRPFLI
jgi:hypothetical protein